jgi:hypothetical protein
MDSARTYSAVPGREFLLHLTRLQAEMDSVFEAVRRIKDRIHHALAFAQGVWVRWVFKPSKQEKTSVEPKAA